MHMLAEARHCAVSFPAILYIVLGFCLFLFFEIDFLIEPKPPNGLNWLASMLWGYPSILYPLAYRLQVGTTIPDSSGGAVAPNLGPWAYTADALPIEPSL